jgi:hypothetical protein
MIVEAFKLGLRPIKSFLYVCQRGKYIAMKNRDPGANSKSYLAQFKERHSIARIILLY